MLGDVNKQKHDKTELHKAQYLTNATDELLASEASFAFWCFFKDMNDLLTLVAQTWSDYCAGKLELAAAAVTVNTAIALVRSKSSTGISPITSRR